MLALLILNLSKACGALFIAAWSALGLCYALAYLIEMMKQKT